MVNFGDKDLHFILRARWHTGDDDPAGNAILKWMWGCICHYYFNCFTMLCWFLLCGSASVLTINIWTLPLKRPSHPCIPPLYVITEFVIFAIISTRIGEGARSGPWDADRRQAQPSLRAMLHALEVPVTSPTLWSQSSSRPGWLFRFAGKPFYWPCLRFVRNDWGAGPGVRRGTFMNNLTKWQPLSRWPIVWFTQSPWKLERQAWLLLLTEKSEAQKD